METFDLPTVPLAGRNLIEANAGTGKTYAISGLFLRLVVEQGLAVGEILVMTYTVAATEELKSRIRSLLSRTLEALRAGCADEPFLSSLLERLAAEDRKTVARRRLTAALRGFDEASIFTIHGFCQRTLQENAFESSTTFDAELIPDSDKIMESILQDFWRRHFYEAPPEVAAYALSTGNTLPAYRAFLHSLSRRPDVHLVPDPELPDRDSLERRLSAYRDAMDLLREGWKDCRETVRLRLNDGALKATSYGGARTDRYLDELEAFFEGGAPWFPLPAVFPRFCPDRLAAACKKNASPPEHPFFTACRQVAQRGEALKEMLDRLLLGLKKELLDAVHTELPAYKTRRNILFFDDLLLRLRDALEAPEGNVLADALRRKYRAALIDEFQDTDPVQYGILRALFLPERQGTGDMPPVFLIGDPKQAIYSFRGADIFAYMAAAREVDRSYTLRENWRSEPALLEAVNLLFRSHPNPFVFEAISFSDSKAASAANRETLSLAGFDGPEQAPLQLWMVPGGENDERGKPLPKGRMLPGILRAVTAEIARLLEAGAQGRAMISSRPLHAGDIAVLVRSNREARLVRQSLAAQGIPAVLHSRENLFDSPEAANMELLLRALETPTDEGRLGAALLTPLLGLGIGDLYRLKADERQWEERLSRFQAYHDLWRAEGFMRMMRFLLRAEEVRVRLLARQDGERHLTNVLHLAEVLHHESLERNLGMRGLIRWLSRQRDPGAARSDEHQLRLESDAQAVKIVTIHKSKGLEYTVAFCPFFWEGEGNNDRVSTTVFHDGDEQTQLLCDLGTPPQPGHALRAYREGLAERIRLFYVALTRAKQRCYLVWGHFNKAESSAPAYLLHNKAWSGEEEHPEEALAALKACRKSYREQTGEDLFREVQEMAAGVPRCIQASPLPVPSACRSFQSESAEEAPVCRHFSREIDRTWRFTSFSSLVFGTYLPQEGAEREREEAPSPPQRPDWLHLPPGTATGNLVHGFLERLDFREGKEGALRKQAAEALAAAGFDPRWEDALLTMIRNVLNVPLSGGGKERSFRLADISREKRLSEMGFYFPLRRLTPEKLQRLFADLARTAPGCLPDSWDLELERLSFNPVGGWLRGYIDLVFAFDGRYYLLDWKTNDLGADPSSYTPEALQQVMNRKHYILQYHLYALALHAYLKQRLPGYRVEAHFGGVYYLFLRGMDPTRGAQTGVFFDRPDEARLTALYDALVENAPDGEKNDDGSR